jgi:large subunit ribosomal protein L24
MKRKKPVPQQHKFHVKKGDEVVVFSGKFRYESDDKRRGKVLQVLRNRNRVLVEGVNLVQKAQRRTQDYPQGGLIKREGPIHISNVMLAAEYDRRYGKASSK